MNLDGHTRNGSSACGSRQRSYGEAANAAVDLYSKISNLQMSNQLNLCNSLRSHRNTWRFPGSANSPITLQLPPNCHSSELEWHSDCILRCILTATVFRTKKSRAASS